MLVECFPVTENAVWFVKFTLSPNLFSSVYKASFPVNALFGRKGGIMIPDAEIAKLFLRRQRGTVSRKFSSGRDSQNY
jgi:hypothetical protein